MAARERKDNSYEDGGGFGKYRKRPFRRGHVTPYDRPPTAIRNSSHTNTNNNNGWLSKLVDPAQRLISASANKLFASVFRKRLPLPTPPQPPELEASGGASDRQQEAVGEDPPAIRGSATNEIDSPGSSSDGGGLTELELIFKQKTFTRSEIDRLTALLQSRTVDVDLPVANQEKKSEVIPSEGLFSLDRKDFLTPVKDKGLERPHVSTPNVLDADVASPAELAKTYMVSRPSKMSPSVLGLRSKPFADDSTVQIDQLFPSKSPIMSVVPKSSGRIVSVENGFLRPRSRGRSAIYSMVRTPYSKVHSNSILQGTGTETNILGSPSFSSQSIRENNRFSRSKQGPLKRRSLVLDNDIGSLGPIRRIRQKSNLPRSSFELSNHGIGLGSDAAQHPSLSQKQALASGTSIENGDNNIHGSSFTSIPSKSSEMASKILQQLDVLVSSREKSPTKLSSSMLQGPAFRSWENIDSSGTVLDSNKIDFKHDTLLPDLRDSLSQKQDVKENSPKKLIGSHEKSASEVNGTEPTNLVNKNKSDFTTISFPLKNSVAQPQAPQHKKWAFQMSAHEDYLELDDDDCFDRSASATFAEENEKLATSLADNKTSTGEAIISEKTAAFSQAKPQGSAIFNPKPPGASDGSGVAGKGSGFAVPAAAPLPSVTGQHSILVKQATLTSDKASSLNESTAAPIFNFGDKVVSSKETNGFSPIPNLSSKTVGVVPELTFASSSPVTGLKFGTSNPRLESSCSFALNAVDATSSVTKEPEADTTGNRNSLKTGAFFISNETLSPSVSTSSPITGIFSFGAATNISILNRSHADSTHSFSSPDPTLLPDNINGQSSSNGSNSSGITIATATGTPNTSSSNNISVLASAPSIESTPAFKFGSTLVSSTSTSSMSSMLATTSVELTQINKETSFGSLMGAPFISASSITTTRASLFGGTSSATTSMGNNIFNDTSFALASTGSSTLGSTSSSVASTGSGILSLNAGSSASIAINKETSFGSLMSAPFASPSSIKTAGASLFGGTSSATIMGSNVYNDTSSALASTGSSTLGGTSSSVASTSSGIFSFNAGSSTSIATNQSQGFNPFSADTTQASGAGSVFAATTRSMPIQTSSSASSPFGLTANMALSSGSALFSSSTSMNKLFSSGATSTSFGVTSSTSSEANPVGATSSSMLTGFGSSWQTHKSPILGSPSSSTGFSFGASTASNATSTTSVMFGSSTSASSGTGFSFSSAATATPSQPVFGNPHPAFTFGSSLSANSDQMNMEDSMAEDTVQATTSTVPVFDQPPIAPQSSLFVFGSTAPSGGVQFGSTAPSGASPFQFVTQPNLAASQNQSPFQASGSLEFNAAGSFSLGTGGGDKSGRKFVRVRKTQRKK